MHEDFVTFTSEKGEKHPCDIQVYALSTFGFCKGALEFLRNNKIAFRFVYVDLLEPDKRIKIKKDLTEMLVKFDEHLGFPCVMIDGGKNFVVGFTEEKYKDAFMKEKKK